MDATSTDQPTIAELIDIWNEELEAIVDLCAPLTDEQWDAPTPCPGWSVGDVVAHTVDIEASLGGAPRPTHEPDWSALPHAEGDFGRFTEIGVDARRGRPMGEVLDELRAAIAMRRPQLDALDPDGTALGPLGKPMPVDRLLRMRIFDTWVHQQDIRAAIGSDGGWNSNGAGIAFMQIVAALPYVWARGAKAAPGQVLHVVIVGPGLHHEVFAQVDDAGRGVRVDETPQADVTMNTTWAALVQLSCGRLAPDDPTLVGRVELSGDRDLGAALLSGMTITP